MTDLREEGEPVARLYIESGETTGWVCRWNTDELAIFWIGRSRVASGIDPPLDREMLDKARRMTPDDILMFLEDLSAR